jgi:hypothetical protein
MDVPKGLLTTAELMWIAERGDEAIFYAIEVGHLQAQVVPGQRGYRYDRHDAEHYLPKILRGKALEAARRRHLQVVMGEVAVKRRAGDGPAVASRTGMRSATGSYLDEELHRLICDSKTDSRAAYDAWAAAHDAPQSAEIMLRLGVRTWPRVLRLAGAAATPD